MAKTKRWQNLQKSVQTQPTLSVQANAQPTTSQSISSVQATGWLASSVQGASQPVHSIQTASQSTSTNQASSSRFESQPEPFKKLVVGRESADYWTVETIDSEENKKKLKLKVKEVLNLSGDDHIVVNFDYLDAPFGEAQPLLAGFCGILAADSSLFPIHFEKWPKMPMSYFDRVFDQIISPRFHFQKTDSVARQYVYSSISKKWSANRLNIWEVFNDLLKSKTQIMDNVPPGIPRDQWTSYVAYRHKKETQEMCKRNAENRKKQTIPHTGGSKANSRRRAEMMAETGKMPGRAQLYLATHKNEKGAYVNEAAKVVCEKIQQTLSESIVDESVVSPNDAVGKVLGKEHSGRVRCLGLGAVPSRVFKQARPRFSGVSGSSVSCPSNCKEDYNKLLNALNQSQTNYKEMVNNHNQMMNAFKAYMIMKEGTLPEQFAGLFASPPTMSSDASDNR